MIDAFIYRSVLGLWPTGVSVVTGLNQDGQLQGVVIGSFCSVSIAPPLIAFCPQKTTSSWQQMRQTKHFCINFLSQEQSALCWKFASGDIRTRFDGVDYELAGNGVPRLQGCCAWIDASIENEIEAGDHWIVVGRIDALHKGGSELPLAFAKGRLNRLEPLSGLVDGHFSEWEQSLNALYMGYTKREEIA